MNKETSAHPLAESGQARVRGRPAASQAGMAQDEYLAMEFNSLPWLAHKYAGKAGKDWLLWLFRVLFYLSLAFLFFMALILSQPIAGAADEGATSATAKFTILHTNDIHGHLTAWKGWEGELAGKQLGGMDRLAGAVNQVRAEVGPGNVILLDAGDTLGDSMIADETQGKAILDAMNAMEYTAMVIGNHEPDFTAAVLKQRIAEASFPLLAANITEKAGGRLFTRPYIIKEIRGVRIGILGLAYPNTSLTTAKKNVEDLEFGNAPEVARQYVPQLKKQGVQMVVVLSHYGLPADKKLAQEVPDIDVIVGGHSHNRMEHAMRQGDTLIVQAGAHGSDLGRLDLEVRNGKITGHTHRLITLDHALIPRDEKVAALIEEALQPYKKQREEDLGQTASPIIRAQTIAGQAPRTRDQESPADSLFADLIRDKTGVDVVILPGVGYGTSIPAGTIRAEDLRNLIPHNSKIMTMTLTGRQIREILEQSLENTYTDDPQKKVGGLVQVSGIRFKYNAASAYPDRLKEVRVNNAEIDLKQDYKVATNTLLSEGGHRYKTFLQGKDTQEGQAQYELIRAAMRHKKITLPEPGRIENLSADD